MATKSKIQWKKEISAGGLVYKKENGKFFILLIKASGKTHDQERKWTFPKGLIEEGHESMRESALREVEEEGGVKAQIIKDLGEIKYFYRWDGQNIFKIVHWYLMEYISGDPDKHDHEVAAAGWYELSEAEKMIGYKTDIEIFERAKEYLLDKNAKS